MEVSIRMIRGAAAASAALALAAAVGCAGGKAKMVTDCSKPQNQTITLGIVNGQAVIVSGCDPAYVSISARNTIQWVGQNGAMVKIDFQSYTGQQSPYPQAPTNCNGTTSSCGSGAINPLATQDFPYKYWFWVGSVKSVDPGVIVKP
jgi:hypothetical protein